MPRRSHSRMNERLFQKLQGISKNPCFGHLNPFPFSKREGSAEFLEMPFRYLQG
jgi:hypothetical protein